MNDKNLEMHGGVSVCQTIAICACGIGMAAAGLLCVGYELGTRHARRALRELKTERRKLNEERKQFNKEKKTFYRSIEKPAKKKWFLFRERD